MSNTLRDRCRQRLERLEHDGDDEKECALFRSQSYNRIKTRGSLRRVEAEEDTNDCREPEGQQS